MVFADQPVDSLKTALEAKPFEVPVTLVPEFAHEISREQQLIKSLMQTAVVPAKTESKENWKTVRMRVTGYCPCSKCCGAFSDGITANNHRIQPGDTFVAADKSYPFGTEMAIPGYNAGEPVQVMDRGGVIKGNRVDLFFHTHQQALEWGVQYLDVLIKIE